jgi:hypothetical protein
VASGQWPVMSGEWRVIGDEWRVASFYREAVAEDSPGLPRSGYPVEADKRQLNPNGVP